MAKRTIPQMVNEYVKKNPKASNMLITDVAEIVELGSMIDIVSTAFVYGYMKGQKAKKGGASHV